MWSSFSTNYVKNKTSLPGLVCPLWFCFRYQIWLLVIHDMNSKKKKKKLKLSTVAVVQSWNHVWLFAISRAAACQAPLYFIISQNLLKFMSFELMMRSNHLILCCPLLTLPSVFPSIRVFSSEVVATWVTSGGQSIGASASDLMSCCYMLAPWYKYRWHSSSFLRV